VAHIQGVKCEVQLLQPKNMLETWTLLKNMLQKYAPIGKARK